MSCAHESQDTSLGRIRLRWIQQQSSNYYMHFYRNRSLSSSENNRDKYTHIGIRALMLVSALVLSSCSTPLYEASRSGDLQQARLLLDQGADAGEPSTILWYGGETPLHVSAENGDMALTELLVQRGASVKATDFQNDTPMHHARNGEIVRFLYNHGGDIAARNSLGETPLHIAAARGRRSAARELLILGADPSAKKKKMIRRSLQNRKAMSEEQARALLNAPY